MSANAGPAVAKFAAALASIADAVRNAARGMDRIAHGRERAPTWRPTRPARHLRPRRNTVVRVKP